MKKKKEGQEGTLSQRVEP